MASGHRPPWPVNPEVWPVYVKRFEKALGVTPKQSRVVSCELNLRSLLRGRFALTAGEQTCRRVG